jgi:hypothetical protein
MKLCPSIGSGLGLEENIIVPYVKVSPPPPGQYFIEIAI